jgi:diacylglycerol kinase (ATP)
MMPGTADQRGLIVLNPRSGTASPEVLENVTRQLAGLLARTEVVRTEGPGHAREIAAALADRPLADRPDVVVVVGGDGTVSETAVGLSRLTGSEPDDAVPALAVVPTGTGNSFYRQIWADQPWPAVLAGSLAIGRAGVRWLDLARVLETGTGVLLGACSGLVAEALITAKEIPAVSGRDRYAQAVALTLQRFRPYPGRVFVDGVLVHEGSTVFANVGGGRFRGGRFQLLPRSVLNDGLLDVCVIDATDLDPADLPGMTANGGHVGRPGVVYGRGHTIRIERTDGLPVTFEHDGELFSEELTSWTLEVVPQTVPVLVGSWSSGDSLSAIADWDSRGAGRLSGVVTDA